MVIARRRGQDFARDAVSASMASTEVAPPPSALPPAIQEEQVQSASPFSRRDCHENRSVVPRVRHLK